MFQKTPEYCRIQPQLDSVAESGQMLLQRIFIQMHYHKVQVILHWRYLTLAKNDDRYSYSTKTTVSAALKILELHQTIYDGLKTGGRLYSVKWRVTALFNHDLLLAISILCFYIQQKGETVSASEFNDIKQAFRQTKAIWDPRSLRSEELNRAAAAIESAIPGILESGSDENLDGSQVLMPPETSGLGALSNYQGK
jgi:hypothetical protein